MPLRQCPLAWSRHALPACAAERSRFSKGRQLQAGTAPRKPWGPAHIAPSHIRTRCGPVADLAAAGRDPSRVCCYLHEPSGPCLKRTERVQRLRVNAELRIVDYCLRWPDSDAGQAGHGRAALPDAADGGEGAVGVLAGLQRDPPADGSSGAWGRRSSSRVELQDIPCRCGPSGPRERCGQTQLNGPSSFDSSHSLPSA